MDKIEFKAYIKNSKEILKVSQINFESESITTENSKCFMFKDIILLQYTGLKDKNNKKIFEGDKVKVYFDKSWKDYNGDPYECFKNGNIEYCVDGYIIYIKGFKEQIYPLSSFGDRQIKDIEVIGNMYKDRKILKRKRSDKK